MRAFANQQGTFKSYGTKKGQTVSFNVEHTFHGKGIEWSALSGAKTITPIRSPRTAEDSKIEVMSLIPKNLLPTRPGRWLLESAGTSLQEGKVCFWVMGLRFIKLAANSPKISTEFTV